VKDNGGVELDSQYSQYQQHATTVLRSSMCSQRPNVSKSLLIESAHNLQLSVIIRSLHVVLAEVTMDVDYPQVML
jgi:hypothetical protein